MSFNLCVRILSVPSGRTVTSGCSRSGHALSCTSRRGISTLSRAPSPRRPHTSHQRSAQPPISLSSSNVCPACLHFDESVRPSHFTGNGTINFIPYLSIAAALDFRTWIGGEEAINTYCHDLAIAGGKKLAETMGTKVMDADGELTVNMVRRSSSSAFRNPPPCISCIFELPIHSAGQCLDTIPASCPPDA